jgi:hypothetical protein
MISKLVVFAAGSQRGGPNLPATVFVNPDAEINPSDLPGWGLDAAVSDLAWSSDRFVAVGRGTVLDSPSFPQPVKTRIASSTDGVTWTYHNGAESFDNGTNLRILVNSNGKKIIFSTTSNRLIISGGNRFSNDFDTWTNSTALASLSGWGSKIPTAGICATYSGGEYYIIGGPNNSLATSTDGGATWTYGTIPGFGSNAVATNLPTAFAHNYSTNTLFVFGAEGKFAYGTPGGLTSSNSLASRLSADGVISGSTVSWALWDGSRLLVGTAGTVGRIYSSTDFITWTFIGVNNGSPVYNGSLYVAAGGSSGTFVTSTNAVTWTNNNSLFSQGFTGSTTRAAVNPQNGTFVIGGQKGAIGVGTSNGSSWTYSDGLNNRYSVWGPNPAYSTVALPGGEFLAGGEGGRVAYYFNGDWTYRSSLRSTAWGTVRDVTGIAISPSIIVAVGESGACATTSNNGTTWTFNSNLASTAWSTTTARSAVWNGSVFCVVGDNAAVATSPDGVTWTVQNSIKSTLWGSTASIRCVISINGMLLVVGDNAKCATSTDNGVSWTYQSGMSNGNWANTTARTAVWNGSQVLIAGDNGMVFTTSDFITWEFESGFRIAEGLSGQAALSPLNTTSYNIRSAAWVNNTHYLLVGTSQKMYTSSNGITWTRQNANVGLSNEQSYAIAVSTQAPNREIVICGNSQFPIYTGSLFQF